MSKHTPGPWETLTYSNHELQTDYVMVKIGGYVYMIGHRNEDKANARFIAAAPELLEAAKAVVERWDSPLWKEQEHTGTFINRLRAVIAKAEGETP